MMHIYISQAFLTLKHSLLLLMRIYYIGMIYSFLVKKAYQTSFVPLWLKAQQIIATETSCQSELANDVVVTGYSEGGFAAVAISDAMHCMGVNVIKMLVGGAPYQIASEQFLSMHGELF